MSGPTQRTEVIGIPWYRRENYPDLRALFTDADLLHETWREWFIAASAEEDRLQKEGKHVVRTEIRPEPFAAWCRGLGIQPDASARARWANEIAMRGAKQN